MCKSNSSTSRGHRAHWLVLLLAAMAWPVLSGAAGGLVPQYSEDLRPKLKLAPTGDAETLEFAAFGRDFRLSLARNERLARVAAGSSVQLYKGNLQGVPGSWARISIQDGQPRGMIWDGRELFVVEAAPEAVNDGAAGTVLFKLSDAVLEQGVSFAGDSLQKSSDPADVYGALIGELRAGAEAMKAGATERVGISILGDAAFLARYSSESLARDAILTCINNVDGIFSSQLGVELQVASVNLGDELTSGLVATTVPSDLLEDLARVRQQTPALTDTGLTHLFTGRQLDGNSAGIAYTSALCSRRFAASLSMAHNSVALDSLITAHEIGHVFGAPHDGVEQCAATPQNQFIMTPTLTSTQVASFSQCSLDQINAVIASYSCLVAIPPTDPAPTPTPSPTPVPPPDDGGGGGGGGGGSLDLFLLLLLFGFAAARRNHRASA